MAKLKAKRIHARVGDILLLPISDEQHVYGQVIDQPVRLMLLSIGTELSRPQWRSSGLRTRCMDADLDCFGDLAIELSLG